MRALPRAAQLEADEAEEAGGSSNVETKRLWGGFLGELVGT